MFAFVGEDDDSTLMGKGLVALEKDAEDDFGVLGRELIHFQEMIRAVDDHFVDIGDREFVGNDSD